MKIKISLFLFLMFPFVAFPRQIDPFKPIAQGFTKMKEKQRMSKQKKTKLNLNKSSQVLKLREINKPYEVESIVVNMVFHRANRSYAKVNNYLIVKVGSYINAWKVFKIANGCLYLKDGDTKRQVCIGANNSENSIRPVK